MVSEIRLEGGDELQNLLDQIPAIMFESTLNVFRERTLSLHQGLVGKFGEGGPLNRRTGSAARSFKTNVSGNDLDSLKGEVYGRKTLAPYITIHEFGGVIEAQRAYRSLPGGPYLNIPIGENLTPAGVMRRNAREVFESGGATIGNIESGYIVIDADQEPMFVLKKRVRIPARLGATELAQDEFDQLISDLEELIDEELNNA